LKTSDGGINWVVQSSGLNDDLFSVQFKNSNYGWISGENGIIIKTTDGGANWVLQARLTDAPLYSIFFTDLNTGWAVGAFGTIIKTTNGGVTFIDDTKMNDNVPSGFFLSQNYPNPFNPTTTLSFVIGHS